MDISLFNLAAGLKKAGVFGGTFLVKDAAGTNNLVFPSMLSMKSSLIIRINDSFAYTKIDWIIRIIIIILS
jgi:hypothetical protein